MVSGQNNVINADPYVHPGPQTDGINTRLDGTHIYMAGLTELAVLWRTSIYATPSTLFPAGPPPTANFIMNTPGYPLQTVAGYSEYRWNDLSAPSASHITTGDGFCYLRDANSNWYITPSYLRTGFCGLAPEYSPDQNNFNGETQYKLNVSPNPSMTGQTSVSFYVKRPGNIRVTILDESGNTIENIIENFHQAGRFEYKVKGDLRPGTYFCQLQADMIGVTRRFIVIQ